MKRLLALALMLLPAWAQACTVSPVRAEPAPAALDRATWVGVVTIDAMRVVRGRMVIDFHADAVLKGAPPAPVRAEFECESCTDATRAQAHAVDPASMAFYRGRHTSLVVGPDCTALPAVEPGRRYLHVRSSPVSQFVFEPATEDSAWLRAATDYLAGDRMAPIDVAAYMRDANYQVRPCDDTIDRLQCGASSRYYLFVRANGDTVAYPSVDGRCFTMGDAFRRAYGLDLEGDTFCLDR